MQEQIIEEQEGNERIFKLIIDGLEVCSAIILPYSLLMKIETLEKERGKGYGTKLLTHIEKVAKEHGATVMKTTDIDPCDYKTVCFFKSMGYKFNLIKGDERKFIEATKNLWEKDVKKLIRDNPESYWITILFGGFLISCALVLFFVHNLKQIVAYITLIAGIFFVVGGCLERRKKKKEPTGENPLEKIKCRHDAQLLAETNRDFLIFYAILFFTCVTAMIELLPYVKITLRSIPADILYFGLLGGLIVSVNQGLTTHRSNIDINRSGKLGEDLKAYEETRLRSNWYGRTMYRVTGYNARIVITAFVLIIFILLFYFHAQ